MMSAFDASRKRKNEVQLDEEEGKGGMDQLSDDNCCNFLLVLVPV